MKKKCKNYLIKLKKTSKYNIINRTDEYVDGKESEST